MSSIYPAAVRLGWDPLCILREMRAMIASIGLANGFTRDNPHGIENCSIVPATINEMLCTAHQHVLRAFKAWPRQNDARFRDLRVHGAFLVSGELRHGEIGPLEIRSEQGRPCSVENPWGARQARVWRDSQPAERVIGERFDLPTHPGEQLRLVPRTGR